VVFIQIVFPIVLALIVSIIQSKWPGWVPFIIERLRTRGPRSTQARLDKISAPDYIAQQRHVRDEKVITGLVFIAGFLLFDINRFISSFPRVEKPGLIAAVFGQYFLGTLALIMFGRALVAHLQTDREWLQKERDGLMTKLEAYKTMRPSATA
jgi:hypothetical protein